MQTILLSIISVAVVSLVSLIGLSLLALSKQTLNRSIFVLVSLSVGVLFGDVFIHILPELFEEAGDAVHLAAISVLIGIIGFFALEKFFRWKHSHNTDNEICDECHDENDTNSRQHLAPMVVVADGVHNMIDGVIIGTAYALSIPVGIATTVAVLLHEIPQEVTDFGILLHAGLSKIRALFFNFVSALFSFVGLWIAFVLQDSHILLLIASGIAAGGFIYIAGSDLVPELHRSTKTKESIYQFLLIMLGIGIMYLFIFFE